MSDLLEIAENCSSSDNPFGSSDLNSSHLLNGAMENPIILKENNLDPIMNSSNNLDCEIADDALNLNQANCKNSNQISSKEHQTDQQVNNSMVINIDNATNGVGNSDSEESDVELDECDMDEGEDEDDDDDDEDDDDDDDDDFMDTDDSSSFSTMSGFTEFFGQGWKAMNWIQCQMTSGANPRDILSQILMKDIASDLDDMTLWKILANMLTEPPRRHKLPDINTMEDVVSLLRSSNKIIVLTGAGVSVSCGIPDFRSADGIYARLAKDYPDLPDPHAMFDIQYFSNDPRPFFKFAREIYPGQFTPSLCHRFIKFLERKGKLLRNYTQNIDTLEQVAGIKNVIECHGSFATASCTKCKFKQTANDIKAQIFAQRIPVCPNCQPNIKSELLMVDVAHDDAPDEKSIEKLTNGFVKIEDVEKNDNQLVHSTLQSKDSIEVDIEKEILNGQTSNGYKELVQNGIMKPDIVFFGEGLPDVFHTAIADDKDECDLLIVIGSSLKVRPVALIPNLIPPNVPQVLINLEELPHMDFDVELLGDSDTTITHLCQMLGGEWEEICPKEIGEKVANHQNSKSKQNIASPTKELLNSTHSSNNIIESTEIISTISFDDVLIKSTKSTDSEINFTEIETISTSHQP